MCLGHKILTFEWQAEEALEHWAEVEGGREMRSGSLRLLASFWSSFPAAASGDTAFWRAFFQTIQPLLARLPTEARILMCSRPAVSYLGHPPEAKYVLTGTAQLLGQG